MATLTISDIPERLLQALEARAAEHGHSVEAETLLILDLFSPYRNAPIPLVLIP